MEAVLLLRLLFHIIATVGQGLKTTAAVDNLLCTKNAGTQWSMVSFKKSSFFPHSCPLEHRHFTS